MLTFMKMSLNQFCHYKVKDFIAEKCDEWQIALVHDIYKRGSGFQILMQFGEKICLYVNIIPYRNILVIGFTFFFFFLDKQNSNWQKQIPFQISQCTLTKCPHPDKSPPSPPRGWGNGCCPSPSSGGSRGIRRWRWKW